MRSDGPIPRRLEQPLMRVAYCRFGTRSCEEDAMARRARSEDTEPTLTLADCPVNSEVRLPRQYADGSPYWTWVKVVGHLEGQLRVDLREDGEGIITRRLAPIVLHRDRNYNGPLVRQPAAPEDTSGTSAPPAKKHKATAAASTPVKLEHQAEYEALRKRFLEPIVVRDEPLPMGGVLRKATKPAFIDHNSAPLKALKARIRKHENSGDHAAIFYLLKQIKDWQMRPGGAAPPAMRLHMPAGSSSDVAETVDLSEPEPPRVTVDLEQWITEVLLVAVVKSDPDAAAAWRERTSAVKQEIMNVQTPQQLREPTASESEVLDAIAKVRKAGEATTLTVHGWEIALKLRPPVEGAPPGAKAGRDMRFKSPEGKSCASELAVKRAMGLVSEGGSRKVKPEVDGSVEAARTAAKEAAAAKKAAAKDAAAEQAAAKKAAAKDAAAEQATEKAVRQMVNHLVDKVARAAVAEQAKAQKQLEKQTAAEQAKDKKEQERAAAKKAKEVVKEQERAAKEAEKMKDPEYAKRQQKKHERQQAADEPRKRERWMQVWSAPVSNWEADLDWNWRDEEKNYLSIHHDEHHPGRAAILDEALRLEGGEFEPFAFYHSGTDTTLVMMGFSGLHSSAGATKHLEGWKPREEGGMDVRLTIKRGGKGSLYVQAAYTYDGAHTWSDAAEGKECDVRLVRAPDEFDSKDYGGYHLKQSGEFTPHFDYEVDYYHFKDEADISALGWRDVGFRKPDGRFQEVKLDFLKPNILIMCSGQDGKRTETYRTQYGDMALSLRSREYGPWLLRYKHGPRDAFRRVHDDDDEDEDNDTWEDSGENDLTYVERLEQAQLCACVKCKKSHPDWPLIMTDLPDALGETGSYGWEINNLDWSEGACSSCFPDGVDYSMFN